jgi:competence protein ComEA
MDPSVTPSWRVLESPVDGEEPRPNVAAAAPTDPTSRVAPGLVRTVAMAAVAGVLAIVAFGLAITSGSGDGVVIDSTPIGSGGGLAFGSGVPAAGEVVVEVVGAVVRPGVFRLAAGSRIADLVAAAGGYGPRVDTARVALELRLAAVLSDGDQVRVPSRDDPPTSAAPLGDGPAASGGLIDLNQATAEELDTLPGIGPVTADKIIAARDEAPFASVDELRARGILGEKTFERIRELVTVS